MAKSFKQLEKQFAGKAVARCMGHCRHSPGTCSADPDYQRYAKLKLKRKD